MREKKVKVKEGEVRRTFDHRGCRVSSNQRTLDVLRDPRGNRVWPASVALTVLR